ncbi:uncharacterized protein LOC119328619 [Triticum dicoccoides]|uniref:uncharacterized protein LOC119328619 n=1 Tax=Triticum dicoccoides TaxID=85692 RepID=UPI0018916C0C|nr:uncharacterized protein LOC119328619 [Triticum dicoccoides]
MSRQEKQNATLHDDVSLGNITKYDGGMLNTEDDDDNDWMHTNLNYQRANLNCQQGTVHVQHIHDMQGQERFLPRSFISGQSSETKDASSEKKRRRMREQYANMPTHDKEVVLCRNRAYKIAQRHTGPLHNQSNTTDVADGSKTHSPSTPSIPRTCMPSDAIHTEEEFDVSGIFEPIQPTTEMEGIMFIFVCPVLLNITSVHSPLLCS